MIMNEFPVCVFACRVVDCVNLFILSGFYVITKTWVGIWLLDGCFDVDAHFESQIIWLNLVVKPSTLIQMIRTIPQRERC